MGCPPLGCLPLGCTPLGCPPLECPPPLAALNRLQQTVLHAFVSKIEADGSARASKLQSTSIRVTDERQIFSNPRNDAEQVPVFYGCRA